MTAKKKPLQKGVNLTKRIEHCTMQKKEIKDLNKSRDLSFP